MPIEKPPLSLTCGRSIETETMTSEPDAKIIDLIQASAKEALAEGAAAGFQSLEFFPPRTDTVGS